MVTQKFIKQTDGILYRIISITDNLGIISNYKIEIEPDKWSNKVSQAVTYWIRMMKQGKCSKFKHGKIIKLEKKIQDVSCSYKCNLCDKHYKSKGGYYKHIKKCGVVNDIKSNDKIEETEETRETDVQKTDNTEPIVNIRETYPQSQSSMPSTVISGNHNNNSQQFNIVNINVRSLGGENPKWITSNLLYEAVSNIPSSIPMLMEKKHFNDKFPENKNLRLNNRRDINHRMQVFEDGKWTIQNTKKIFDRVICDIVDILMDGIENTDIYNNNSNTTDEEKEYVKTQYNELCQNKKYINKYEKIQHIWEEFQESMEENVQDKEERIELFEEFKTMLLNRQLLSEQGYE